MIGVHQLNEYSGSKANSLYNILFSSFQTYFHGRPLMGGCVALRKHLASLPAALGLNPLSAEIFLSDNISLFCLVCEQH